MVRRSRFLGEVGRRLQIHPVAAILTPRDRRVRLILLAGLALASPAFAQDDEPCLTDCAATTIHPCACPPDCDQTYCEQVCPWIGCHTCTTQCRPCSCGGFGIAGTPDRVAALPGPSTLAPTTTAEANTPAGSVSRGTVVTNELGTFIIYDGPTKTPDATAVGGIGVKVAVKDGRLLVIEVEPDGPAAGAGVEEGQAIESIDGAKTAGLDLLRAVRKLRGKPGTRVALRLEDTKSGARRRVTVTRRGPSPRASRRPIDGVMVREFRLKELGEAACPATRERCVLLAPSGEYCVYACR